MAHKYAEIAFTDQVRAIQNAQGSRDAYARMDEGPDANDRIGEREAAFIAARDSFYMASVSETGWPYVQHRGGPAGFLRVLDEKTLVFADFRGNRQFVSLGNVAGDDRVSLFLMDYPNRARLKIFGRVEIRDDEEAIADLALPDYRAKIKRAFLIRVEGFDWNCPQHITRRFSEADVVEAMGPLKVRIAELEGRLEALGEAS